MSALEQLFADSFLEIAVPSASIEFPSPDCDIDNWLEGLEQERQQAFFDEQLRAFFLLRVKNVEKDDSGINNPPKDLLSFLAHLQVSLEASYISPVTGNSSDTHPNHNFLSAPPRGSVYGKLKAPSHPPIVLPNTPNPTPATTDNDKRYINAEGTPLLSIIWGQKEDPEDVFGLHWSEEENAWIAVYQLSFTVAFLRLSIMDPLLCLTVSATLRDKPITANSTKHPLADYLARIGGLEAESPPTPAANNSGINEGCETEEVNLLEGLSAGPNFQSVSLPSVRLGSASRRSLFSLAPVSQSISPIKTSPTTTRQSEHTSTLRKSFRKTLTTASGFRVRMRTTFVPYVFLSLNEEEDLSEIQERTVILCVEIENHGEGGKDGGFAVEAINVKISGSGASTTLIGLGDGCFGEEAERNAFPLKLKPFAQVNLLYAVTFLQSPDETVLVSATKRNSMLPTSELKRSVVIDIHGRPFTYLGEEILYPARTFSSRWNCVLDLSPQQPALHPEDDGEISIRVPSALPEPPSPFPPPSPRKNVSSAQSLPPAPPIIAGKKRHTFPTPSPLRMSSLAADFAMPSSRSSLPVQSNRFSVAKPVNVPNTPAFAPPQPGTPYHDSTFPSTPSYPYFPPQTPTVETSQSPVHSQHTGIVGPSVDIRRAKDPGMSNLFPPPTPGPTVGFNHLVSSRQSTIYTEPSAPPTASDQDSGGLVVSIGLVHPSGEEEEDKIRVMEQFTLDVFVFNRSERITRLEISHPKAKGKERGVIVMDNRVRIGPLRPMTCQAVRMRFLALATGVHTIDALTLTNTETGRAINLRNVLDVVVHEPESVA